LAFGSTHRLSLACDLGSHPLQDYYLSHCVKCFEHTEALSMVLRDKRSGSMTRFEDKLLQQILLDKAWIERAVEKGSSSMKDAQRTPENLRFTLQKPS
jgi:hypothetical protein